MNEKEVREAIEIIKSNYPTSGYYMLCEALDTAIEALEKQLKGNQNMDEKKKCPFCGGEAKLKMKREDYGWVIWNECCECHSRAEGYVANLKKEDEALEEIKEAKCLADEAWNRRTEE